MESAGVDEAVIEKVCNIIDELAIESQRECPQCMAAWAKEEQKVMESFDA